MEKQGTQLVQRSAAVVWDCGSTLYDSFELESLRSQLDSALSARSLSMPHLSDEIHHRRPTPSKTKEPPPLPSKKNSRVPKSLLRLFRSVFELGPTRRGSSCVLNDPSRVLRGDERSKPGRKCNRADRVFATDDKHPGFLATIPEEAPDAASPDINPSVRKTASERFGAKLIGVPCAQTKTK